MLSGEEQQRTVSEVTYPHPEVIAHSILGVRDIGLSPNHRINPFVDDNKDKTIRPSPDEKLYYLKNTRPKVDVNVRGHSGSFIGDSIISKTARDQSSIIRPPGYSSRSAEMSGYTKSLLDKSIRRPKKYESPNSSQESFNDVNVSYALSGTSYGTGDYEPTPITIDRPNNESTTENMSVTSSELPKQIPAPPSRLPSTTLIAQTTPVQKYALRRTDILPGYSYGEAWTESFVKITFYRFVHRENIYRESIMNEHHFTEGYYNVAESQYIFIILILYIRPYGSDCDPQEL